MEDEILNEFLAESWKNLIRLDTEVVSLKQNPSDLKLISSIFRTIHTIKGTCGFIGLASTGILAHSTENVLGKMRSGELAASPKIISVMLKGIDGIKSILQEIEATGTEPNVDNSSLINELNELASQSVETIQEKPSVQPTHPAAVHDIFASRPSPTPAIPQEESIPNLSPAAVQLAENTQVTPNTEQQTNQTAEKNVTEEQTPAPEKVTGQTENKKNVDAAELSIQVNVDLLDGLVNLVSELVLTRNQLLQLARSEEDSTYTSPITHLNRITSDLQEGVMKTRMQPISSAWSRLPRLVRELCETTGRQIELQMSGAETELDRTVLDAIKDPLIHMVRNSADHGIELPEDRLAAGKPEVGTIKLNACHEGGRVVISILDDGAGINVDRVLEKAVNSNLVSETEAEKLTQNEILPFIFHPGFSTAEYVSSVSGRGVGMDVVKTAIDRIGGTVELSTNEGYGTEIKIKIPLTLAIISALVVQSGG